ncbi:MAG TPA: NosD domain-containing protein, partial [Planctomycetota bacterium]|nr:NosD domain-containing protein [Planctomycetota bacterium]
ADWLWPHENDEGQWLARYGAAISLTDCDGAIVRTSRGRHGQNGILMLRCTSAMIYDNDFSFLSGWGLAMYRSSKNIVSRNILDYCVRGYSHGVYWRGQDSAAILMFERCSDNLIAYNSATHSGDGIFLFAGRDSVEGKAFERGETEVGGCDRNTFYGNDFSFAVANGIEATFSSDNRCLANQIRGCHQHGVWGGYSRRMTLVENNIEDTLGGAITVEHGQDFRIAENVLHDNQIAIELYWDEDAELVKGPFGKHFDTSSSGHAVVKNSFSGNDSDFVVMSTERLTVGGNVFAARGRELTVTSVRSIDGSALETPAVRALLTGIGGWSASGRLKEVSIAAAPAEPEDSDPVASVENEPPHAPGVQHAFDPDKEDGEGLETIVMGEWGPWDFRSGEARPVQRVPGGLLAGAAWDAAWFSWKDGPDPRGNGEALAAWRALAKTPLVSAQVATWYTPFAADPKIQAKVGLNHFGLIAKSSVKLEQGRYRLVVVSDDGVRVLIDGIAVLENWTWHAPTRDAVELELGAGQHAFELEYFQIDGASALSLDLERLP